MDNVKVSRADSPAPLPTAPPGRPEASPPRGPTDTFSRSPEPSSKPLDARQLAEFLAKEKIGGYTLQWAFPTKDFAHSRPEAGPDGTVYFGSNDFTVYAVDEKTGKEKWSFKTGERVYAGPSVDRDGTVYIPSSDGRLYAFDGQSGAKKWATRVPGTMNSKVLLGDGDALFMGGSKCNLYAFDKHKGSLLWTCLTGDMTGEPAHGPDGSILAASHDRNLYCVDAKTGAERWTFDLERGSSSTPVVGKDGTVYASRLDGKLFAVDGRTGRMKWEKKLGPDSYTSIDTSPVLSPEGDMIYYASNDNVVYGLDSATGDEKWHFPAGRRVFSSPAVAADGTVFIGSDGGRVHGLDGKTGREVWRYQGDKEFVEISVDGDRGLIFAGCIDGNVYAFKRETLEEAVTRAENLGHREEPSAEITRGRGFVRVDGVKLEVKREAGGPAA